MYLTLPLPIQKKWNHKIYYIPWDTNKAHVKVPIEVNRNSTFKEVRQVLGRWMEADPDHVSYVLDGCAMRYSRIITVINLRDVQQQILQRPR